MFTFNTPSPLSTYSLLRGGHICFSRPSSVRSLCPNPPDRMPTPVTTKINPQPFVKLGFKGSRVDLVKCAGAYSWLHKNASYHTQMTNGWPPHGVASVYRPTVKLHTTHSLSASILFNSLLIVSHWRLRARSPNITSESTIAYRGVSVHAFVHRCPVGRSSPSPVCTVVGARTFFVT